MERLGGVCSRKALKAVSRGDLERAVERGEVVKVRRGHYALPTDVEAQAAARRLTGVAILLSAAAHWGWARKWTPKVPQIAVPRGRKIQPSPDVEIRWRTIPDEDTVDGWVTSRARTLVDCAVLLPFDEALAVADSALRVGLGKKDRLALKRIVATLPVQHRKRVRRVMREANAAAAGPFESVLRAIALDIPWLNVATQVRVDDADGGIGRVDLADVQLRLVLEADSMEYHGERSLQDRDCARYTRLTTSGWLVLRFTWEQVMHEPEWVRDQIVAAVALRRQQELCCLPENYQPVVA
ncbi:hypothetical protein N802_12895 [Knoellia sinensis KCTC 19936]|uniref:DUF559 domain-containing protein n=1 Tax=Knoellia sinensis KCTC 19936 TaxID=1385520 RepID=A0A0A0JB99_9MICO|nr:hypothetical protein N802_12895 [Knoellia sinensis KCTC 19936]